jgi:hypothetical protein
LCFGILQEDENAPDREHVSFSDLTRKYCANKIEIATTDVGMVL